MYPRVPPRNLKGAQILQDEWIKPLLIQALKQQGALGDPAVAISAVADAGETIRLVMSDRQVFDVVVKVTPWENPDNVYM